MKLPQRKVILWLNWRYLGAVGSYEFCLERSVWATLMLGSFCHFLVATFALFHRRRCNICQQPYHPSSPTSRTFHSISTNTHTHTRLTAPFPGLPGWAGTRKVKPIWISLKQETVSGSSISWDICKSAPSSWQITTPAPHHSVFYRPDALPAAQSTASKHWRQHATMTNSQFHMHYECYCQIFNTRRQTDRNMHITTILRRLLGPNQHPQLERGDFVRTKFSCHMPVITTTMHPD